LFPSVAFFKTRGYELQAATNYSSRQRVLAGSIRSTCSAGIAGDQRYLTQREQQFRADCLTEPLS